MSVMKGCEGGGSVVRCGYLKKLKTSRRKFFVLRAETAESSARLEYYDSERKYQNGLPPKRSIPLKNCFNINRRLDTKHKHVIALYTKDDCFCVVLDCEEDVDSWLKALLSLQHGEEVVDGEAPKPTFEHVWQVTVLNRGLGTAGLTGNYRLCLTDKTLSLIKRDCEVPQIELNLTNIRSCGNLRDFFFLEIGRSSTLGAGELWMQTEDNNIAQNVHSTVFHAMSTNSSKEELGPKYRGRSSSATESSKPNTMGRKMHSNVPPKCHILSQVLNFFPVPVEEECLSDDGRRKGICMNAYECRIESGSSHGPCALGFGVCCVFTSTCSQEVHNNITYFVNPHFPDLSENMEECSLTVKKLDPEISQLRLDFIHFNLGQPNRKTGVCEEDVFILSGGASRELRLCGLNSGQHAYFDVENIESTISIRMNLARKAVARLWEVRVTQIPFTQRAPAGCLQYHTGATGTIQTMNFADNGRHLADQDYNICMRQEEGMCSIAYEPCHENAFRISPNNNNSVVEDDVGSGDGAAEPRSMEICTDKIVLPCDSDDLLMPSDTGPGFCDLVHCGESLCPSGETPCRIESSATPFTIGVHFGPSSREAPPDDNLGMCLTYEQLPCNV